VWLFSDVLSRAFGRAIPLLGLPPPVDDAGLRGFWDWGSGRHVTGIEWFFVALAFVAIDLSVAPRGAAARG
jgi:hypothetical protein